MMVLSPLFISDYSEYSFSGKTCGHNFTEAIRNSEVFMNGPYSVSNKGEQSYYKGDWESHTKNTGEKLSSLDAIL